MGVQSGYVFWRVVPGDVTKQTGSCELDGCDVTNALQGFVQFYKFFVIFGGQTNRPTDQQTDRPTDLGIEAPSRSLKTYKKLFLDKGANSYIYPRGE